MADTFPLPRSGSKLLRLILIGYLHAGGNDRKAMGPSAVGSPVGLDPTVVSRNNAFLAAVGLIEQGDGRKWRLTEPGVDVARAYEYEASEELGAALGDVLRTNDFTQKVVAFVRSRGSVEEQQVVSHMARLAGVRRASDFLTGARAFLELMYVAGLLESDGQVVQARAQPAARATQPETAESVVLRASGKPGMTYSGVIDPLTSYTLGFGAGNARVNLNLQLTAKDLASDRAVDALVARLKRLIDGLSASA